MTSRLKKLIAVICAVMMVIPFIFTATAAYEAPFDNSFYYTEGEYTLHYRIFKAENEKAKILMVHGFGCSTSTWEPVAKELVDDGYTCVLVDLPGFGYSTRETEISEEGYIVREVAGQIVALPTGDDLDLNVMITLNGTGKFLWELIEKCSDVDSLVAALLAEYDVDEATARAGVERFVAKLNENGFLA